MVAMHTVGHGTLDADDIAGLLRAAGVTAVADVRRYPGSRRHPHFASEAMERWLPDHGVAYAHIPALGGRRRPDPSSPNVGLRNQQFRAYADHMASGEFRAGAASLLSIAADEQVALLCAESVWWRCHRRLLADHLVLVEGVAVDHLFHDGRHTRHEPTAEARRVEDHVVYDVGVATPLFDE